MIIPNDKKKTAGLILAKLGTDGKDEAPETESTGSELHDLASDLIAAINDNSPKGVASAIKAFLACCDEPDTEE